MEKPLKISDLVEATGLSKTTIHYYTRENLLSEPIKTARTMSYYTQKHIAELEEIIRLKEAGYPLSFIKKMTVDARKKKTEPSGDGDEEERIRENIIEKATESFATIGYHATELYDVARSAGVDPQIIYLYFPDKQKLFEECLSETFKKVFKEVWEEIKDEENPFKRIYQSGLFILTCYRNSVDLIHEIDHLAKIDEDFSAMRKEFIESLSMLLKSNLLKAYELGLMEEYDMDLICHYVIGIAEGGCRLLEMDTRYSPEDYLQAVMGIFELAASENVYAAIQELKRDEAPETESTDSI
ncbi:MAG: MerR family transcriptional regulator [Actinobacteria bacterium]|nr:MerR family transcriptional regulator [Actinomycetota bacterium]